MPGRNLTICIAIASSLCGTMVATAQNGNPLRAVAAPTVVSIQSNENHQFDANATSARIIQASPAPVVASVPVATPDPTNSIPSEVYQAMYPGQTPRSKGHEEVRVDLAVQPTAHTAPVAVERLPVNGQFSEPSAAARQMTEPGNNLSALGHALTSVKTDAPASVQADDAPETAEPRGYSNWNTHFEDRQTAGARTPQSNVADADAQSAHSDLAEPAMPHNSAADQTDLRKMIEHLAISTCVVLCGGVGFIFVAKQWMKLKGPTRKAPEAEIEIKSTLQLSPKSSLHLVQAGNHRMMVASDQNGIKSVVPLNDSFSDTLNGLEAGDDFSSMLDLDQPKTKTRTDRPHFKDLPTAGLANSSDTNHRNPEVTASSAIPGRNASPARATPDRSLPPELYSLATVGRQATGTTPEANQPDSPSVTTAKQSSAKPRMDDALRDQQLRDLLLRSLETK